MYLLWRFKSAVLIKTMIITIFDFIWSFEFILHFQVIGPMVGLLQPWVHRSIWKIIYVLNDMSVTSYIHTFNHQIQTDT